MFSFVKIAVALVVIALVASISLEFFSSGVTAALKALATFAAVLLVHAAFFYLLYLRRHTVMHNDN